MHKTLCAVERVVLKKMVGRERERANDQPKCTWDREGVRKSR